jgi:hypothetical protein
MLAGVPNITGASRSPMLCYVFIFIIIIIIFDDFTNRDFIYVSGLRVFPWQFICKF